MFDLSLLKSFTVLFVLSTHGSLIKADDFLPPVLQQYGAYLAAPSGIGIHGTNLQSKPDNLTDFTFLGCDPKNNTIRHSPLVATPSPTSSSNSTDSSIKAVTDQGGVAPHCEPHIVVFDANAKHVHYTAKWYDGYPKSVRSWEEWSASIDNTYPGSQMTLSDAGVSVKSSAVCTFTRATTVPSNYQTLTMINSSPWIQPSTAEWLTAACTGK